MSDESITSRVDVVEHRLDDDGTFPNNPALPLLVYPGALRLPGERPEGAVRRLFEVHGWGGAWVDGIYRFPHYHSTAHEVLGCFRGRASVQLGGGEKGVTVELSAGDVVVIPAGVAHENLGDSGGFGVVGAYPRGQSFDMNSGKPGERPEADRNVARVPLPTSDPVYGEGGPLVGSWGS